MDWQSADPSLVIRHLQGAPLQPVGPQGITVEGAVFEDLLSIFEDWTEEGQQQQQGQLRAEHTPELRAPVAPRPALQTSAAEQPSQTTYVYTVTTGIPGQEPEYSTSAQQGVNGTASSAEGLQGTFSYQPEPSSVSHHRTAPRRSSGLTATSRSGSDDRLAGPQGPGRALSDHASAQPVTALPFPTAPALPQGARAAGPSYTPGAGPLAATSLPQQTIQGVTSLDPARLYSAQSGLSIVSMPLSAPNLTATSVATRDGAAARAQQPAQVVLLPAQSASQTQTVRGATQPLQRSRFGLPVPPHTPASSQLQQPQQAQPQFAAIPPTQLSHHTYQQTPDTHQDTKRSIPVMQESPFTLPAAAAEAGPPLARQSAPTVGVSLPLPLEPAWLKPARSLEEALTPLPSLKIPLKQRRGPAPGIQKPKRIRITDTRHLQELEKQFQTKLALAEELIREGKELRRKERLLELSVATHDASLTVVQAPQVDVKLQGLLNTFRSCYSRDAIDTALMRTAHVKSGRDITLEIFGSCYLAYVSELQGALAAHDQACTEPERAQADFKIQEVTDHLLDFLMAIAVDNHGLMVLAQETNLVTGEHSPQLYGLSHWAPILDRIGLTDEQIKNMVGVFDLWHRCLEHIMAERRGIKKHLATLTSLESRTQGVACLLEMPLRMEAEQHTLSKLMGNIARGSQLHVLLHWLSSRFFTPRQLALLCVEGMPCFINQHLNVAYLKVKNSEEGDPHRPMAQAMLRMAQPRPAAPAGPTQTQSA